jgi:hypothetical protein
VLYTVAIKNEKLDLDSLQPTVQTAVRLFWRFLDEFGEKYTREDVALDMDESGVEEFYEDVIAHIEDDFTIYMFNLENLEDDLAEKVSAVIEGMVNGTTVKMIEIIDRETDDSDYMDE